VSPQIPVRVDVLCPLCRDAFDREVILTAELDLATAPITVANLTGCGHAAMFGELGPLTFEEARPSRALLRFGWIVAVIPAFMGLVAAYSGLEGTAAPAWANPCGAPRV